MPDFWNRLFNRKVKPKPETTSVTEKTKTPRRKSPGFNTYTNPFTDQSAGRWPPDKIVKYTFEALEAWARDKNIPRQPDETAIEFAKSLGETQPKLKQNARVLAQLYSQLAYAGKTAGSNNSHPRNAGNLSASNIRPLSEFWNQLTQFYSQVLFAQIH